ncbi:MAG TPA: ubiquinone biosynthesis regulatory protein kinase UbiB, partial [Burkholderiales bacterium]|nr:ubiquinone biosynthesis regulatory protein kinase UbiB [Burkholderiales bacterium]
GLLRNIRSEAPQWGVLLPQLPRLLHRALSEGRDTTQLVALLGLLGAQQRRNRLLGGLLGVLVIFLLIQLYILFA